MSSVGIGGLGQETPELLELRKKKIEAEMEGGETPNLFTVLPEVGLNVMNARRTHWVSVERDGDIPALKTLSVHHGDRSVRVSLTSKPAGEKHLY